MSSRFFVDVGSICERAEPARKYCSKLGTQAFESEYCVDGHCVQGLVPFLCFHLVRLLYAAHSL